MENRQIHLFGYTHSGSTYLLNILFELGICVHQGDVNRFWRRSHTHQKKICPRRRRELAVWFPKLQQSECFHFPEDCQIQWTHDWPTTSHLTAPAILMLRNPYDVLLSEFKRVGDELSFGDHLRQPVFSDSRSFYPSEKLALYNHTVHAAFAGKDLCVVTFEKLRQNPIEETERVLAFLGIRRNHQQIRSAVDASAFDVVKAAADRWYRRHPELQRGQWRAMRKGKIGEWRDEFEADASVWARPAWYSGLDFGYFNGDTGRFSQDRCEKLIEPAEVGDARELVRVGKLAEAKTALVDAVRQTSQVELRNQIACAFSGWLMAPQFSPQDIGHVWLNAKFRVDEGPLFSIRAARGLAAAGLADEAHKMLSYLQYTIGSKTHEESALPFAVWREIANTYKRLGSRPDVNRALRHASRSTNDWGQQKLLAKDFGWLRQIPYLAAGRLRRWDEKIRRIPYRVFPGKKGAA